MVTSNLASSVQLGTVGIVGITFPTLQNGLTMRNVQVWYWDTTYTILTVKQVKNIGEAYKMVKMTGGKIRYSI